MNKTLVYLYCELAVAVFFTLLFAVDCTKKRLNTRRERSFHLAIAAMMVSSYVSVLSQVVLLWELPVVGRIVESAGILTEVAVFNCFHCYILSVIHRLDRNSNGVRFNGLLLFLAAVFPAVAMWAGIFLAYVEVGGMVLHPSRLALIVFLGLNACYQLFMVGKYYQDQPLKRRMLYLCLILISYLATAAGLTRYYAFEVFRVLRLFLTFGFYMTLQNPDSFIDHATGAYNRNGFCELFKERMDYCCETACLLLRVRNYHALLEIYGEKALAQVQEEIWALLKANCKDAKVFRVGASTLAVMTEDATEPERLYRLVRDRMPQEWDIAGQRVRHTYSWYQIAYPQDGQDYDELMQRIHYARSDHPSKHKSGTLVRLASYNVEESEEKKKVASLVEQAIMDNSIELHFQPIYSIEKEKITSLEVLSRLKDEQKQYINPEYFIHVAEENHTIIQLGEQIFRKACKFAGENHIFEYGIEDMNINLSPTQCRYEGLVESFCAIAAEYEIPMHCLHMEITETEFTDVSAVGRTLKGFKEAGAKIALDDFGTGYSTLVNILELPIDFVKIDKSLVWSYGEDENHFLDDLLPMIKAEGKKIIAEGIETVEHMDIIKRLQGDFLQGYYFSKPLPEAQFIRFLQEASV